MRIFALLLAVAAASGCAYESGPSGPPAIFGATAVSAGGLGTCALGASGALVCWGAVPPGVDVDTTLGVGVSLGARSVTIPSPMTAISLSRSPFAATGCGVAETDQVYCWGNLDVNMDGTLSLGSGIAALTGATSASTVSLGPDHLCVTRTDNVVRCYGDWDGGARGTDSADIGSDPDANLVANGLSPSLSAFGTAQGARFGCALRTDSLVACWGERNAGQLGGAVGDTLQDCGIHSSAWCQPGPGLVSGGTRYRQLAVGFDAACATRISGEVDCWGRKLGAEDCTGDNCLNIPTVVALPGTAARVVVGQTHACALLNTGAAYCWGNNEVGQLGRSGGASATPVAVSGGFVFATIAAGAHHTCGIESGTGAVGCWGINDNGQLGDGTLVNRDRPVAVVVAE
jgi:hypothetical protein